MNGEKALCTLPKMGGEGEVKQNVNYQIIKLIKILKMNLKFNFYNQQFQIINY